MAYRSYVPFLWKMCFSGRPFLQGIQIFFSGFWVSSRGDDGRGISSEQPSPEFILYEAGIILYLNVSPQSAASMLTTARVACHMGWGGSWEECIYRNVAKTRDCWSMHVTLPINFIVTVWTGWVILCFIILMYRIGDRYIFNKKWKWPNWSTCLHITRNGGGTNIAKAFQRNNVATTSLKHWLANHCWNRFIAFTVKHLQYSLCPVDGNIRQKSIPVCYNNWIVGKKLTAMTSFHSFGEKT